MTAPDVALRAELLEKTQWAHEFSFLEIEKLAEYLQSRSVKRGIGPGAAGVKRTVAGKPGNRVKALTEKRPG